jgi:hypothetical protein
LNSNPSTAAVTAQPVKPEERSLGSLTARQPLPSSFEAFETQFHSKRFGRSDDSELTARLITEIYFQ